MIVLGYLRIKSGDIPVAARHLTEAFQISVARDLDRPFGKAVSGLGAAHRIAPDAVSATWTAITGLPISALIQPGD